MKFKLKFDRYEIVQVGKMLEQIAAVEILSPLGQKYMLEIWICTELHAKNLTMFTYAKDCVFNLKPAQAVAFSRMCKVMDFSECRIAGVSTVMLGYRVIDEIERLLPFTSDGMKLLN